MRKIFKLISMVCLAISLFSAAVSAQDTETEPNLPGKDEPGMMTICYYGVTMKVSQKVAKRYMKLGATMGACGEEPTDCPLGYYREPIEGGGCIPMWWVGTKFITEKPVDSEKAIPLDLPMNMPAQGLLSMANKEVTSR